MRRIGLVQIGLEAGEAYDPELHQLPETLPRWKMPWWPETLAAGYTYQGQMLRRPVVALKER